MTNLADQLADAEAKVAWLRRAVASASCREVGCDMVFHGGKSCDCEEGGCSRSVYVCSRCGDCDYGENEESDRIVAECAGRRGP